MNSTNRISGEQLKALAGELDGLLGLQFDSLLLPLAALQHIEPSQIGTIVGTLMDALIPHVDGIAEIGLEKHEGLVGDREGYPDYRHPRTGLRVELKLLFVDNPKIKMKKPPTRREPSARLTQKVTIKNVIPATDAMLLIAYQLQLAPDRCDVAAPTIVDLGVFSMIDLVEKRDKRLLLSGGRWFGDYETPCVLSRIGREKVWAGLDLDIGSYGRKESEGRDFNEDTNFGKLSRIPHPPLRNFLLRWGQK